MWKRLVEKQPELDKDLDLFKALGISRDATADEVDQIYMEKFADQKHFDKVVYIAWKVLRDSFYAGLYRDGATMKELYDAGFFIDKILPTKVSTLKFKSNDLLTTPFHKILNNLAKSKPGQKQVVLLTTGGFSPIHHGHLSMMEAAKEKLEEQGIAVVGGYLSPSHDDYVSTKYGGEAELNSAHRIYLSRIAVNDSEWLMVDPWEANYVPTDINFTDVLSRLQDYLRAHVPKGEDLEVFYVFGADNAGFVKAFENSHGCVCVSREGVEVSPNLLKKEAEKENIFFTKNVSTYADFSSSNARKWKANLMPDEVSYMYFKWRKNILSLDGQTLQPRKLYIIRDEDDWSLEPWMDKVSPGKLLAAKEEFKNNLAHTIRNAFLHVALPDLPVDVDIRFYQLEQQLQYVEQLARQENVLNLDVCTNNGQGINFSRQFYLSDGQFRSRELLGRPGFPSMKEQISSIKPGNYTLVDDDIASGSTINMLMGLLPETVKITKIRTLMDYSRRKYNQAHLGSFDQEAFDVVDLRDFIIGAKAGGLVISLPNGEIARAPYLQPYISLISRASIPPSTEISLSKSILQLNLEFFKTLDDQIRLKDFDPYAQKLFAYLGFSPETSAVELCKFHLKVYDQG